MSFVEIKGIKIGQGMSKICIPFMGATIDDYIKLADELNSSSVNSMVDVVEIRADYYESLNDMGEVNKLMKVMLDKLLDKVVLFTIRSEAEGGEKLSFSSPTIAEINEYVIENRLADLVDVELCQGREIFDRLTSLAKTKGVSIIASNHDFKATPAKDDIVERLSRMQEFGADIAKIAVMPNSIYDVFTLMEAAATVKAKDKTPVVGISMGKLGAISRVSGEIYGSDLTFGTMGAASAPGQVPVSDLKDIMSKLNMYAV